MTRVLMLLLTLSLCSTSHAVASKKQTLSMDSTTTSMEEVAAVDVLSEICPKILGEQMNRPFSAGYRKLLADMLPSISDPALGVQTLHDNPEYMQLLQGARDDAANVTIDENRQVCLDVVHYGDKPSKSAK